ncbi:type II secretion system protein [bacterium]|nr:type II secretion system protein [bacterium]
MNLTQKEITFTLAEGPRRTGRGKCNSLTRSLSRRTRAAFTLAEVLITLGIIGVVAAMTIPTLMANIKGMQYRNQFKKTISTVSNAARMSLARYDFDFAGVDKYAYEQSDEERAKANPETEKSMSAIFNGTLAGASYLGYVDMLGGDGYSSVGGPKFNGFSSVGPDREAAAYQLADGSIVGFMYAVGNCALAPGEDFSNISLCYGFIDVNGFSLPNKEIKCSDNKPTRSSFWGSGGTYEDCIVKNSDITDIFPIIFHDTTVEPASNAAKYVLNTTK